MRGCVNNEQGKSHKLFPKQGNFLYGFVLFTLSAVSTNIADQPKHINYLNLDKPTKHFTHLKRRRMVVQNITVTRLLMGIVTTSCTVFIYRRRLLLIGCIC